MDAAHARVSTLAIELVGLARGRGLRIATAESLTGGLLADALVTVPGASHVMNGGVVAYHTALKHTLLGVDAALLAERGPVDAEVARQMARGVRRACAVPTLEDGGGDGLVEADIGISTTGVAGPDPDAQTGQAVGTVWIGISSAAGERAVGLQLTGGRSVIRAAAVEEALRVLAVHLARQS